jgi:hypothetical protein
MAQAAPYVARIVWPLVSNYGPAPAEVKSYYRSLLKSAMRDLERFVQPLASRAALDRAAALRIGDPRGYTWNDQPTKMKDPERTIFHWDHIIPVSDLAAACLDLPDAQFADIEAIISKARVVWILRDEDRRLRKYGRGDDPFKNYRDAGVELIGI